MTSRFSAPSQVLRKVRILTRIGLWFIIGHEREYKNKPEENANFVHIVYLLANIFDEAFLLTSVCLPTS